MDQVKKVGEFLWTYRFWFALGLVLLLAFATYPSGSQALMARTKARISQLNSVYSNVERYRSGATFPNRDWVEAAGKKKETVVEVVGNVWEEIYRDQEKLMTWPEDVADRFFGKPFGSDLTDKELRNTMLVRYRRAFPEYVLDTYDMIEPLELTAEGKIKGRVDCDIGLIGRAVWTRTPTSLEAWLAQEELWVQRAIFKAIAQCNQGYEGWSKAPVRKLNAIALGEKALDSQARQAQTQLQSYGDPGGPAGGGGGQNLDPARYLEKTPQYRTLPVFVSLMVDQMQIPRVLAILSGADFGFTIHQVNILTPVGFDVPQVFQETGSLGERGGPNDPIYNSFQVDIWGRMRIYEMPPKLKAEYEEKEKAAEAKAAEAKKAA